MLRFNQTTVNIHTNLADMKATALNMYNTFYNIQSKGWNLKGKKKSLMGKKKKKVDNVNVMFKNGRQRKTSVISNKILAVWKTEVA